MASDNYPYGNQPPVRSPSPISAYDPRNTPSQHATPAPSYHTNPYQPPASSAYGTPSPAPYGSAPYPQDQPGRTGPSPFETVFDDHVYPMNSRNNLAAGSTSDMSQQNGFYQQDTGYHGPGNAYPNSSGDIPLQDRTVKPGEPGGFDDHVYDVQGAAGTKRGKKNKKVALGQLGMFGADKKRIPWVVYIFSVAQVAVFIGEIVRNGLLTGSPIMIKPQFNFMIGPSTQVMINMGARYAPCMHNVDEIQGSEIEVLFLCPEATKWDQTCPLNELCGFGGGVPNPKFDGDKRQSPQPNQWYRFIIPIFLHAGLIHIAFNLLLQLTLAKEMEMAIGSIRFVIVYLSAGIFGFVLGGNFAAPAIASTGASGSLFGILALNLLDLLYSWRERKSPVKDLMFIILDMVISFVLGLLPGLDNFSHIGGFLMGLCLGISVLHSPNSLRLKIGPATSYAIVPEGAEPTAVPFLKNPVGFFKGRKPLWWAWWLVRAGALVIVVVVFIVLLNRFYTTGATCDGCKYLSCLPINNWCELGTIQEQ